MMAQRHAPSSWDWYGQLTIVAACILALAVIALVILAGPAARDPEDRASRPASRAAVDPEPMVVIGANIASVPGAMSAKALAGALSKDVRDLPWERALVRRAARSSAGDSVFFPVSNIREAFLLCRKLAAVSSACAPVVASSDELTHLDGRGATRSSLAGLGVAPSLQKTRPTWWRTKFASADVFGISKS